MKEEFEIREFDLGNKKIKLKYFFKKIVPIAHSGIAFCKIQVDKIFYKKFNHRQQKAIIFHEIGHKKKGGIVPWVLLTKSYLFWILIGLLVINLLFAFYFNLWLNFTAALSLVLIILLTLKIVISLSSNKTSIEIEFACDKYSALKNNKKDILEALKIIKRLVEKENLPYNLKNHPPIDERIKRIRELK